MRKAAYVSKIRTIPTAAPRSGARALTVRGLGTLALALAACAAHAVWPGFANNAQHTGLSATPAQPLSAVRWSTPVDLGPTGNLIHYGSPVITSNNTVITPIKTGGPEGYRLDARKGSDGTLLWSAPTDYLLPLHGWTPSYQPTLAAGGRVWYAGAGGTVLFRDNVDAAAPITTGRAAFYGLAAYNANPASFNTKVYVNTPLTADAAGNVYFGIRTRTGAPLGLAGGIARVDANGNGIWIPAASAAGDAGVTSVPHQAAPALSNDESTLYVVVTNSTGAVSYLVGLDAATLAVKEASPGVAMRVALKDPRSGGANNAVVADESSASPMVGPDGDVYYGVLGNPFNGARGWLLHFSANLQQTKAPGGFGWDTTAAVVPAAAVPSYSGTSSYLIFTKYNNYAGYDDGDGVNKIAILDPNATMREPHPSSAGLQVMKVVLETAGLTPEAVPNPEFPNAVREWCINAAAVDPFTKAVLANSEDGKIYRWDLTTNTLSQAVTLSPGRFAAYTSTVIGPDGTVYAINSGILNAIGTVAMTVTATRSGSGAGSVDSIPAGVACGATCTATFPRGQAVSLTATPQAGSIFSGWLGACTGTGACVPAPAGNVAVSATFAPAGIAPLRIDLDGNTKYDALTDGLLALRYLFGVSGAALTSNALGMGATRNDPSQLLAYLDDIRPLFDIDGNGEVTALSDGLLLIRHLFGLRGESLTGGAIGPGARRTTASDIDGYIESLKP